MIGPDGLAHQASDGLAHQVRTDDRVGLTEAHVAAAVQALGGPNPNAPPLPLPLPKAHTPWPRGEETVNAAGHMVRKTDGTLIALDCQETVNAAVILCGNGRNLDHVRPSTSGVADGRSLSNGGYSPRGGARDGATGGHQPVRARRRGAFSSSSRPPWIASSRAPTRAGFIRIRSVPISIHTYFTPTASFGSVRYLSGLSKQKT